MREWYGHGDKLLVRLEKQIHYTFHKSLIMPFDEINQMGGIKRFSKEAERIYRKLDRLNREAYFDLLEYVYVAAWKDAGARGTAHPPGEKWVSDYLLSYDPVTKYVYEHEVDRKRARFFEAIVADAEAGNRLERERDYKTAERLWVQMARQYMLDVEDAAAMQAYKDAGVKKVMWVTERDERVCKDCKPLDGQIFEIDKAPAKLHWYCRCILVPV